MPQKNHLTTQHGCIVVGGFAGRSLYGLWVTYGAAPDLLALLGLKYQQGTSDAKGDSIVIAAAQGPIQRTRGWYQLKGLPNDKFVFCKWLCNLFPYRCSYPAHRRWVTTPALMRSSPALARLG